MLVTTENRTPPIRPDQVLLGLILGASLGPFRLQPTTKPPMSTAQTTSKNQKVTKKPTNSYNQMTEPTPMEI